MRKTCISPQHILVLAPAKLNLYLEVLSKRNDGFHDLKTLMTTIDRYDCLVLAPRNDAQIHFQARWGYGLSAKPASQNDHSAFGDLPTGEKNLIVQALMQLRQAAGRPELGINATLLKRIPSQAGLGGASSDAASALVAGNQVWNLKFSTERLQELAAQLGSDIPFFFSPGYALCTGRGEQVQSLKSLGSLSFVVIRPPAGLSTKEVFSKVDLSTNHLTEQKTNQPLSTLDPMSVVSAGGQLQHILYNRLQEPARSCSPWIDRVCDALKQTDTIGFLMSGSGSSCYLVCRHARQARRLAKHLFSRRLGHVFKAQSTYYLSC